MQSPKSYSLFFQEFLRSCSHRRINSYKSIIVFRRDQSLYYNLSLRVTTT